MTSIKDLKKKSEGNQEKARKSASLPSDTVEYLKAWMMSPEHVAHPYPTEKEKSQIMKDTGIELKQLTNWFVNNRKRYWKPRVEARLQQQQAQKAAAAALASRRVNGNRNCYDLGVLRPLTVIQQTSVSPCISLDMTLSIEPDIRTQSASDPYFNVIHQARNESLLTKSLENTLVGTNTSKNAFHSEPCVQKEILTVPTSYSTEDMSPQVVSIGSTASSFASDCSDSNDSISNDEYTDSPSCIQGQVVTFSRSEDTTQNSLPNLVSEKVSLIPDEDLPSISIISPDSSCTKQGKRTEDRKSIKRVRSSSDFNVPTGLQLQEESCLRPRALTFHASEGSADDESFSFKRRRFVEHGVKPLALWKGACQNAVSVHDDSLPSLEEATFLFGFAKSN